jgi:hypothetical protein
LAGNNHKVLSLEFVRALWNFKDITITTQDNTIKKAYETQVRQIGIKDGLGKRFIDKKIKEIIGQYSPVQ